MFLKQFNNFKYCCNLVPTVFCSFLLSYDFWYFWCVL